VSRERFGTAESFHLAMDKKHNADAAVLFIIMESALFAPQQQQRNDANGGWNRPFFNCVLGVCDRSQRMLQFCYFHVPHIGFTVSAPRLLFSFRLI
jgi:hypothetical protein